jgi:VanZ family protein
MVFWGVGFLLTQKSSGFVASITLAFSIFIELSQLYHAEWIDAIRHTTLGGLILGFGFLWSDVICYTIGAAMGFVCEKLFIENINAKKYPFKH